VVFPEPLTPMTTTIIFLPRTLNRETRRSKQISALASLYL